MTIRSLTKDGDWTLFNGRSSFKTGNKEIAQRVTSKLLLQKGEVFFFLNAGVNWRLLGDTRRVKTLLAQIETEILTTEGVIAITDRTIQDENKELKVQYVIQTVYDELITFTINNQDIIAN